MPAAISAAVVSSAAMLGRSGPQEGGIRNAPLLMASCSVALRCQQQSRGGSVQVLYCLAEKDPGSTWQLGGPISAFLRHSRMLTRALGIALQQVHRGWRLAMHAADRCASWSTVLCQLNRVPLEL